jgi:hypothetical protein
LLLPDDELGIHRQSGHAYAKTGPIWAILGEKLLGDPVPIPHPHPPRVGAAGTVTNIFQFFDNNRPKSSFLLVFAAK